MKRLLFFSVGVLAVTLVFADHAGASSRKAEKAPSARESTFEKIDADGNGVLSKSEFTRYEAHIKEQFAKAAQKREKEKATPASKGKQNRRNLAQRNRARRNRGSGVQGGNRRAQGQRRNAQMNRQRNMRMRARGNRGSAVQGGNRHAQAQRRNARMNGPRNMRRGARGPEGSRPMPLPRRMPSGAGEGMKGPRRMMQRGAGRRGRATPQHWRERPQDFEDKRPGDGVARRRGRTSSNEGGADVEPTQTGFGEDREVMENWALLADIGLVPG